MLQGLTLIFVCQLAGEALVRLLGVPFPGPVAGMVILLVGLIVAGGPSDPLRRAGLGLLSYLPLFFVPAGVGLVAHGSRLRADWLPILLAIVGSTLLTMLLVGWLIARYAGAGSGREDAGGG
jgi:holin-like protein